MATPSSGCWCASAWRPRPAAGCGRQPAMPCRTPAPRPRGGGGAGRVLPQSLLHTSPRAHPRCWPPLACLAHSLTTAGRTSPRGEARRCEAMRGHSRGQGRRHFCHHCRPSGRRSSGPEAEGHHSCREPVMPSTSIRLGSRVCPGRVSRQRIQRLGADEQPC